MSKKCLEPSTQTRFRTTDYYGTWGSPTSGCAEGSTTDEGLHFHQMPLVTNDISNIPGKKLLSAEDGVQIAAEDAAAGFFGSIY